MQPGLKNSKLMIKRILIIIITFILISGCKKAKLLKQIDGNWQVNKIVYSGGTLSADSVVNNSSTNLFFKKCGIRESRSVSNCTGTFGEAGNQAAFNYSFYKDNNEYKLAIFALPPSSDIEKYNSIIKDIAGAYEIIELNASTLKIKSTCCADWPLGADTYRTRYIEASQ